MHKSDELKVIVLDSGVDIEEIENVRIIRVKSDNYNLLIFKDYMPLIGEINGSIIVEGERTKKYENIKGFYSISRNIFHLIISEKGIESDK